MSVLPNSGLAQVLPFPLIRSAISRGTPAPGTQRPERPRWWRLRQRWHSVSQSTVTKSLAPFSDGSTFFLFSLLPLMKQEKLFLLPLISLAIPTSSWALDFQVPSLHAQAMFINSSFVASPRSCLRYTAFFALELSHEVPDKPSRYPRMSACFPEYWGVPLSHLEDADLKDLPAFQSSFAFQSCRPWDPNLTASEIWKTEICSPKVQGLYSAALFSHSSQDLELQPVLPY